MPVNVMLDIFGAAVFNTPYLYSHVCYMSVCKFFLDVPFVYTEVNLRIGDTGWCQKRHLWVMLCHCSGQNNGSALSF